MINRIPVPCNWTCSKSYVPFSTRQMNGHSWYSRRITGTSTVRLDSRRWFVKTMRCMLIGHRNTYRRSRKERKTCLPRNYYQNQQVRCKLSILLPPAQFCPALNTIERTNKASSLQIWRSKSIKWTSNGSTCHNGCYAAQRQRYIKQNGKSRPDFRMGGEPKITS